MSSIVEISVIIPVGERHADAAELHAEYLRGLRSLNTPFEMIFVLDGPRPKFALGLEALIRAGHEFTVVKLTRYFGESTALMAGFEQAAGAIIITLPAYHQIDGQDIGKLVAALDSADIGTGYRFPRAGGRLRSSGGRHFTA